MKNFLNENRKSIIFWVAILMIVVASYFLDKDLSKILAVAGFFVWFLREYTKQLLAKDLEKFKTELQKESIAYKTKYEKIHAERAEVIKKLYSKFHKIKDLSFKMANKMDYHWQFADEEGPTKKEYNDYIDLLNELKKYIERNRIFFDEKLVKEMISIVYEFDDAPNVFSMVSRNTNSQEEVSIKQEQSLKRYKLISGNILKPLEIEFKKILDIDYESS